MELERTGKKGSVNQQVDPEFAKSAFFSLRSKMDGFLNATEFVKVKQTHIYYIQSSIWNCFRLQKLKFSLLHKNSRDWQILEVERQWLKICKSMRGHVFCFWGLDAQMKSGVLHSRQVMFCPWGENIQCVHLDDVWTFTATNKYLKWTSNW